MNNVIKESLNSMHFLLLNFYLWIICPQVLNSYYFAISFRFFSAFSFYFTYYYPKPSSHCLLLY